jgi:hypothetical protein
MVRSDSLEAGGNSQNSPGESETPDRLASHDPGDFGRGEELTLSAANRRMILIGAAHDVGLDVGETEALLADALAEVGEAVNAI